MTKTQVRCPLVLVRARHCTPYLYFERGLNCCLFEDLYGIARLQQQRLSSFRVVLVCYVKLDDFEVAGCILATDYPQAHVSIPGGPFGGFEDFANRGGRPYRIVTGPLYRADQMGSVGSAGADGMDYEQIAVLHGQLQVRTGRVATIDHCQLPFCSLSGMPQVRHGAVCGRFEPAGHLQGICKCGFALEFIATGATNLSGQRYLCADRRDKQGITGLKQHIGVAIAGHQVVVQIYLHRGLSHPMEL